MDDDAVAAEGPLQLAHGLDEGIALNVTHGAANLGDDKLIVAGMAEGGDALLDFVGDMGNDLHGLAQEVATALLLDDILVDAARGDVVGLRGVDAGKALVVAEVEVGLGPVLSDVALAMFIGIQRAGVDVDVGVQLLVGDGIAAGFEQTCQ